MLCWGHVSSARARSGGCIHAPLQVTHSQAILGSLQDPYQSVLAQECHVSVCLPPSPTGPGWGRLRLHVEGLHCGLSTVLGGLWIYM
jgi:hypothetical protein